MKQRTCGTQYRDNDFRAWFMGHGPQLAGYRRLTIVSLKRFVSLLTAFLFAFSMILSPVFAEVVTVDGGTIDINTQDNVTNWNVTGNPVWNVPEFNVAAGSTYNITGLGEGSSLALLVGGGSATNIFGTLNLSNLDFILQNIYGINIGASGLINVRNASFIGTTLPLNLDATNFLTHQYLFEGDQGLITNEGRIVGHDAALVALVANAIENRGTIDVPMGHVALAAGDMVTVGISRDGMVSIGVDEATANELGLKDQLKNSGSITADGGKVSLTAKAIDGLFEKAINIGSEPQATAVIRSADGIIEFVATGDIVNSGELGAGGGAIEIDTEGIIENKGTLRADLFREHGYTFKTSGHLEVLEGYYDNTDLAADFSGAVAGGTHNDVNFTFSDVCVISSAAVFNATNDITFTAGSKVTLGGDTTLNADSDATGTGSIRMAQTSEIAGAGHDLTLKASGTSTLGKIAGIEDMVLGSQTDAGATYRVRNLVTMTGDLTVDANATLTGGYSVTVGGGDVTGDGTINMTGGTFTVVGDGSFGGSNDWTFWELQFGDGTTEGATQKSGANKITALTELKIQLKHTLKAGSSSWDLSWGGGYLTDVIQIVSGASYTLALLSSGIVKSWGYNHCGQLGDGTTEPRYAPVTVSGLSGVVSISAGYAHALALLSDGTVVGWGLNEYGQVGDNSTKNRFVPVAISGLSGVIAISAGYIHSLAVLSDGSVKGWGYNGWGQIGDGTTETRLMPVDVPLLSDVGAVAVAAGHYHSMVLMSDGTIESWGKNWDGQLGNGTTDDSLVPVIVSGLSNLSEGVKVSEISVGEYHSMALLSDGTVMSWGSNRSGQLGDGTRINKSSPSAIPGLSGVVSISAGYNSPMVLLSDGTVLCWGGYEEEMEYYGGATYPWQSLSPVKIDSISDVTKIAAGSSGFFVAPSDGTVWGWGDWMLGNNTRNFSTDPVQVLNGIPTTALTDISKISAGRRHNLALKSDGSRVYAWGGNNLGQLGNETTNDAITPVQVLSEDGDGYLSDVYDIAAGGDFSLALMLDGTVRAWGHNSSGQLGNGSTTSSLKPVTVLSLSGVTAIAAGSSHALALLSDKTLWSWGSNSSGQLGDGTTENRTSPFRISDLSNVSIIAAGGSHSLALLEDHSVWSWGSNSSGQLGDGTQINRWLPTDITTFFNLSDGINVIDLSAGPEHSMALLSGGTVMSWGENWQGRLGDGTGGDRYTPVAVAGLSGCVAIDAGYHHSLALLSNGNLMVWGGDSWGMLGQGRSVAAQYNPVTVPSLSSGNVMAVSSMGFHSLALLSDGTVVSWGNNELGQIGNSSFENVYTPTPVLALLRAPLNIVENRILNESGEWVVEDRLDEQNSTFLYTGDYAFGRVTFTEIADVQYNNLVLKYHLDDYILPVTYRGENAGKAPTMEDLGGMASGRVEVLGEEQPRPEIDLEAAQKQLEWNIKHMQDLTARFGDQMMRPFGSFFDPSNALRFDTNVSVIEGAVYVIGGDNVMNLLGAGDFEKVEFRMPREFRDEVAKETVKAAVPVSEEPSGSELPGAEGLAPVLPAAQPVVEEPLELKVRPRDVMWDPKPFVAAQNLPRNRDSITDKSRYGTVENADKDVFMRIPGGEWQPVTNGMVILPGDEIRTAPGASVTLVLDEGKTGTVEIREGSLFRINRSEIDPKTGDKTTLLDLAVGKLLAQVEKLQGDSRFEVRTPQALTGVRGTIFEVEVKPKS